VRCRRGRLQAAADDLVGSRAELADLADPGRVGRLADDVAAELGRAGARARSGDLLEPPSKAELVVLRMLDSDLSISQIAERLHLSTNTVKSHIRAVYRKLGVTNRADAVSRACSCGLLDRSQSPG
jgi:LuxR family maltose regulon positive regulatory protein